MQKVLLKFLSVAVFFVIQLCAMEDGSIEAVQEILANKVNFVFPRLKDADKLTIECMGDCVQRHLEKEHKVCMLNLFPYNKTDPAHYTFDTGYLVSEPFKKLCGHINVPVTFDTERRFSKNCKTVLKDIFLSNVSQVDYDFYVVVPFEYFNHLTARSWVNAFFARKNIVGVDVAHNTITFAAIQTAWNCCKEKVKKEKIDNTEQITDRLKNLVSIAQNHSQWKDEEVKAASALWHHFLQPLIQNPDQKMEPHLFDAAYNYRKAESAGRMVLQEYCAVVEDHMQEHYPEEPAVGARQTCNVIYTRALFDSLINSYQNNIKEPPLLNKNDVFILKFLGCGFLFLCLSGGIILYYFTR